MITDSYRDQMRTLHSTNEAFGTTAPKHADRISEIINRAGITNILDYGCGKGLLGESLKLDHKARVHLYDPGIPGLDERPEPQEMVCCIDVLEHIEPDYLDSVLDDLQSLTQRVGFFTIGTTPAVKILPDGRNAHLIQEPPEWWLPKIMQRFQLQAFSRIPGGFLVVVCPLPATQN